MSIGIVGIMYKIAFYTKKSPLRESGFNAAFSQRGFALLEAVRLSHETLRL